MSMKSQIHTELNRLAALAGTASGPQLFSLDAGDGRLEAELTAIDPLACAFDHYAYRTSKLANCSIDQLKDVADALSKRLSYLLEAISPIEVDIDECIVQMRSNPPQKDDDGTRYYELTVSRREIHLCRYAKTPGQPRDVVSANVTREVFERLGEDFIDAA